MPINRVVRLCFHQHNIARFFRIFEESKHHIRQFEGCLHLELWQDEQHTNIIFTYSRWENTDALNHYRKSALFKETWAKTKPLFADKPQAWSVQICEVVPPANPPST